MSFGKSTHSQSVNSSSLDNAIALQTGGWHHEALEIYNKILVVEPGNSVALVYGGVALLELGQVADAVTRLEDAAALYPGVSDIHGYLANALLLAKRPKLAERHYLKAAELSPEDPTPLGNLGILLKDQDRLEEAMEQFRHAISIKDDYGPAYRNLCDCLRRMGRIEEAIDIGKRAILVDPNNAEAHNNLGVALADAGQ